MAHKNTQSSSVIRRPNRASFLPALLLVSLAAIIAVIVASVMRPEGKPAAVPGEVTGGAHTVPMKTIGPLGLPLLDQDDPFDAVMVDVGQGDCMIIMSRGEVALIDAGDNGSETVILECFEQMGIERLDIVVGTHAHADHIASLDEVIASIEISALYMGTNGETTKAYGQAADAAARQMVPVSHPKPGDKWTLGDLTITVLWPAADEEFTNENNASITLLIEGEDVTMLLVGDMESLAERRLVKDGKLRPVDVLKVGHHGADTSSTTQFLQAVTPRYALISVGLGNRYKHPRDEVLARLSDIGAAIWRTDVDGHIIVDVEQGDVTMRAGGKKSAS